jgi:tetratricopeptide (TPR) repeat protein
MRVAALSAIALALLLSSQLCSVAYAQSAERNEVGSRVVAVLTEKKYTDAWPLAKEYADLTKKDVGERHRDYGFALLLQAEIAYHLGGAEGAKAEPLYQQALQVFDNLRAATPGDLATALARLSDYYLFVNRKQETEQAALRSLAIFEKVRSPDHRDVAVAATKLGDVHRDQNKCAEAVGQYRRALEIIEAARADDPESASIINRLADCLITLRNHREADELIGKAVSVLRRSKGDLDPGLAVLARTAARLSVEAKQFAQAEEILDTGLTILLRNQDEEEIGDYLNHFALFHAKRGNYGEAEALLKRALQYLDKPGGESLLLASALNNLVTVEIQLGRKDLEVPMLAGRAHRIRMTILGERHPDTIMAAMNAVEALVAMGDKSALWIYEMMLVSACNQQQGVLGAEARAVALCLNNLGHLYVLQEKYEDAAKVLTRAVEIYQQINGREHPATARALMNLAGTYQQQGDEVLAKAGPLLEEVIATYRKTLGPWHSETANAINNLAWLRSTQQDWTHARELFKEAAHILVHRFAYEDRVRNLEGAQEATVASARPVFLGHVRAAFELFLREKAQAASLRDEAFRSAQWASQTAAGTALRRMSLRFAIGEQNREKGDLFKLVRERQDLLVTIAQLDKRLIGAASDPDQKTTGEQREDWRREMVQAEVRVRAIDNDMPKDYVALTNPQPLSLEEVKGLLQPDEALMQLVFHSDSGFAWLITREGIEWRRLDLGVDQLSEMVRTLRCGLDVDGEWRWAPGWEAIHEQCKALEKEYNKEGLPPFQFDIAHQLYLKLFAPIEAQIAGKQLMIVTLRTPDQ